MTQLVTEIARNLALTLEAEREAIVTNAVAELARLVSVKRDLIGMLEAHADARSTEPSEWPAPLRETLIQCQTLNQRNGALLEMRYRHNDRILNILHAVPDDGNLYDANGTTHRVAASRYRVEA